MPSPFMQDIQGGAREWPTSDKGKRLQEARAG